jgi:O-antigen/teichoic acid export membrane protein
MTFKEEKNDIHGRDRLHINVIASWGGLIVRIISGFILPRLIDKNIGQVELGIWDFAWSIVNYFTLVQLGINSSINRYVALYRAKNDVQGVNRSVSSVYFILLFMALFVVILSICSTWFVSLFFRNKLGDHLLVTQWLIVILGVSLAVHVSMSTFGSVLTGCYRNDLQNGTFAFAQIVTLIGMVIILLKGKGLIGLSIVYLAGEIFRELLRFIFAFRVFPGLKVRRKLFQMQTAKEMLRFGGKTFLFVLGEIFLSQTVNVLIVAFIGPAGLALYSRPRVLVRYVRVFLSKYSIVLVPTISSQHSQGDQKELIEFIIKSVKYGIYFFLPIIIFLFITGGNLIQIWMGVKYRNDLLLRIIAFGYFAFIAYLPLFNILMGLNLHGRPSIANFIASCMALLLSYISLSYFSGGLIGIAVAISIPLTIVHGIYIPVFACKHLKIPIRQFIINVWKGPVLCCIPYTVCLLIVSWFIAGSAVMKLLFWFY